MKKRQLFSFFLFLTFGLLAISGCEDVAQVQTPVNFASLRVANFNNICSDKDQNVYDVYIYPAGEAAPELPVIRGGLGYGKVSPWLDNLETNRESGKAYKIDV